MLEYLIDASVLFGFFNEKDAHHLVCKKFFEENAGVRFHLPAHAFFELQHCLARRQANGSFRGAPTWEGTATCIPIDKSLYSRCKSGGLFVKFAGLKGSDLIYASVAKLEGLTLVTCDGDFDKYGSEFQLLRLNA